jgi:predicted Zn-dependent protease
MRAAAIGGSVNGMRRHRRNLVIVAVIATAALVFAVRDVHRESGPPVADVALTPELEIALGLHAAPQLAQRYGGLSGNADARRFVDEVGAIIAYGAAARGSTLPFDFHLLATPAVNAASLPGGQVFVTEGLYSRIGTDTAALAAVLAHEVGHVIARHAAEQLLRLDVGDQRTGAAVLATYDPEDPRSRQERDVNALLVRLTDLHFTLAEEARADSIALRVVTAAGFPAGSLLRAADLLAPPGRTQAATGYAVAHAVNAGRRRLLNDLIRSDTLLLRENDHAVSR